MPEKQSDKQVLAFRKESQWKESYQYLRNLIFDESELEEAYKWMHPTYTINDKNVITIHGFKHYVALLFHKGAIIEDETLIQQTERVQAKRRQIRFKTLEEIKERRDEILYYINEAIEVRMARKLK